MKQLLPKLAYFGIVLLFMPKQAYAMHIMEGFYQSDGQFSGLHYAYRSW